MAGEQRGRAETVASVRVTTGWPTCPPTPTPPAWPSAGYPPGLPVGTASTSTRPQFRFAGHLALSR